MLMNLPLNRTVALHFIYASLLPLLISCSSQTSEKKGTLTDSSGVAILLVDTDHPLSTIDKNIYGHFLEHINHSVEDGLYAEQIQGCGFEGKDFETYWKAFSDGGRVENADIDF